MDDEVAALIQRADEMSNRIVTLEGQIDDLKDKINYLAAKLNVDLED